MPKQTKNSLPEIKVPLDNNLFHQIFYNTETPIALFDRNGVCILANNLAANFLGIDQQDVTGKRLSELHPDQWPEYEEIINQVMDSKQPKIHADWVQFPDGPRWIRSIVQPIEDVNGSTYAVQVTSQDLTEAKNQVTKLRQSEEMFRLIADHASDMIWIADMEIRTIYISPCIEKILGFTPEERKRQLLDEQLTPRSLNEIKEVYAREMDLEAQGADPDRVTTMELEYFHKNGSIVLTEMVAKLLRDDDGKPVGIHGITRDITERKRSETALKQAVEQREEAQFRRLALQQATSAHVAHEVGGFLNKLGFALTILKSENNSPEGPNLPGNY